MIGPAPGAQEHVGTDHPIELGPRILCSVIACLLVGVLSTVPSSARAQGFGGQYGGGGGFWLLYAVPEIEDARSFDRDLGALVMMGGRGFFQIGRVRLGGGGFGGSFTDEGLNVAGNDVTGGLSAGGFSAEYLLVRHPLYDVALGGLAGGGTVTVEERVGVSGDVESLNRRRDAIFIGLPWIRGAWNPAPFVNVGLQLGYLIGTEDFGGFTVGLDVLVGLIP